MSPCAGCGYSLSMKTTSYKCKWAVGQGLANLRLISLHSSRQEQHFMPRTLGWAVLLLASCGLVFGAQTVLFCQFVSSSSLGPPPPPPFHPSTSTHIRVWLKLRLWSAADKIDDSAITDKWFSGVSTLHPASPNAPTKLPPTPTTTTPFPCLALLFYKYDCMALVPALCLCDVLHTSGGDF